MSSLSYSQSATRTARKSSPDSLVVIPKQLVIYMLQDLIQADSDRVDLGLTRESLELYQNYSDLQAKTIERQTMRYETAQALLYEITDQRDSLERELLNCNKEVTKVKKSRRGWIAATFTSLTLLFVKP